MNITISQSPTDLLKLDTTNLGTFIPGLVKEFGKGWPCMINVIPAIPPHVNITDIDIEIDAEINVSFLCLWEGATEFENAVTIRNKANFTGGIDITNLLTIHGHITEIILLAEEVVESIIGDVNLTILNYLINIIADILKFGINAILVPGINISDFFPFLKPLELSEIDIYFSDYYLAVEAFPKIDEKAASLYFKNTLKSSQLLSSS